MCESKALWVTQEGVKDFVHTIYNGDSELLALTENTVCIFGGAQLKDSEVASFIIEAKARSEVPSQSC